MGWFKRPKASQPEWKIEVFADGHAEVQRYLGYYGTLGGHIYHTVGPNHRDSESAEAWIQAKIRAETLVKTIVIEPTKER